VIDAGYVKAKDGDSTSDNKDWRVVGFNSATVIKARNAEGSIPAKAAVSLLMSRDGEDDGRGDGGGDCFFSGFEPRLEVDLVALIGEQIGEWSLIIQNK
jgi:hypothetical protein